MRRSLWAVVFGVTLSAAGVSVLSPWFWVAFLAMLVAVRLRD